MPRSWFSHSKFYPVVIGSFAVGIAADLIGTYVFQPWFEHEGNPFYHIATGLGITVTWPRVIAAKVIEFLVCALGLLIFLRHRRTLYPRPPATFSEVIIHLFYGRRLSGLQIFCRLPRLVPTLSVVLAAWSLQGPYYAYLGYENLFGGKYGWPTLGGTFIGPMWMPHAAVIWFGFVVTLFPWAIWQDYRHAHPEGGNRVTTNAVQ